jgi:hypothetical protein
MSRNRISWLIIAPFAENQYRLAQDTSALGVENMIFVMTASARYNRRAMSVRTASRKPARTASYAVNSPVLCAGAVRIA